MARHKSGDLRGAVADYQRALDAAPRNAAALHYLGLAEAQLGDHGAAERHVAEAAGLAPDQADIWANLGKIRIGLNLDAAAVEAFQKAVAANEADFKSWNNLGGLLRKLGRTDEALNAFSKAYAVRRHPRVAMNMAAALRSMERFDDAVHYYQEALEQDPRLAEARVQIASVMTELGRFDDAKTALLAARDKSPEHPRILAALLTLRSSTPTEGQIELAERLASAPGTNEADRVRLGFALARAYERKGVYDAAFTHATEANQIVARSAPFDADALEVEVAALERAFGTGLIEKKEACGSDSERPVFIVGLPRTGTTLTEQILSSHPEAAGAGELPDIALLPSRIAMDLSAESGQYLDALEKADCAHIQAWAQSYLDRIDLVSRDAKRVVDKFPFNFSYVGLIAALFPRARIIHCQREPRDVFVSCYFTEFTDVLQAFRTSQTNFIAYYKLYQRIMALWDAVLPGRIHHLKYERLVDDFDAEARALVEHCGLDWDDKCAQFFANERAVRTPSRWQVRQPIYRTSVERWRSYEKHLDEFEAAGL
ncbi:MAG: sulfotransferase [Pseudomonadota bacterium]